MMNWHIPVFKELACWGLVTLSFPYVKNAFNLLHHSLCLAFQPHKTFWSLLQGSCSRNQRQAKQETVFFRAPFAQ